MNNISLLENFHWNNIELALAQLCVQILCHVCIQTSEWATAILIKTGYGKLWYVSTGYCYQWPLTLRYFNHDYLEPPNLAAVKPKTYVGDKAVTNLLTRCLGSGPDNKSPKQFFSPFSWLWIERENDKKEGHEI